jgi:tRNA nucleotidyltransferase (CCA-adding enzyme)
VQIEPNQKAVRKAINKIGKDYFPQVLEIKRADTLAQSDYHRKEKLDILDQLEELYNEILSQNQCVSLKELEITGSDLIKIGVPTGKLIGEILNKLLDEVIENPEDNKHEILMEKARDLKDLKE